MKRYFLYSISTACFFILLAINVNLVHHKDANNLLSSLSLQNITAAAQTGSEGGTCCTAPSGVCEVGGVTISFAERIESGKPCP